MALSKQAIITLWKRKQTAWLICMTLRKPLRLAFNACPIYNPMGISVSDKIENVLVCYCNVLAFKSRDPWFNPSKR